MFAWLCLETGIECGGLSVDLMYGCCCYMLVSAVNHHIVVLIVVCAHITCRKLNDLCVSVWVCESFSCVALYCWQSHVCSWMCFGVLWVWVAQYKLHPLCWRILSLFGKVRKSSRTGWSKWMLTWLCAPQITEAQQPVAPAIKAINATKATRPEKICFLA